jgi:hypothetical protein
MARKNGVFYFGNDGLIVTDDPWKYALAVFRISSRTGRTDTPLFLSSPTVFASLTECGLPFKFFWLNIAPRSFNDFTFLNHSSMLQAAD